MRIMTKTIFVSTPITGFGNMQDFLSFKECAVSVIDLLKSQGYIVYNEFEHIESENCFDSPSKSVDEDFMKIEKSDVFILIHPRRMQTSSLIELGYACALQKRIIIIGNFNDLPFLAKGLRDSRFHALILDHDSNICETLFGVLPLIDK